MERKYGRASFGVFGFFLPLVLFLSIKAEAFEEKKSGMNFGLKLTGGMGVLLNSGGDLEKVRLGTVDHYSDLGSLPGYSSYVNWDKRIFLPALEADLIFQMSPYFGIGIGSGYLTFRSQGNYGAALRQGLFVSPNSYFTDFNEDFHEDYKLRAIPIRMSLYGYIPHGSWNLYGHAGAGYYFGHLTDDITINLAITGNIFSPTAPDQRVEDTADAQILEDVKKNALGFDGGLGVGYKLGDGIEFGVECFARYVEFSGWSGSLKLSSVAREKRWTAGLGWSSEVTTRDSSEETGLLYYFESNDSNLNKNYGAIKVSQDKPSDSSIRNVREASINLNALGIVFTIRLYFNLK